MKKINKPSFEPAEVFRICISGIETEDLATRLESISEDIETAEIDYENAAASGQLAELQSESSVAGRVSSTEMKSLYKTRLAARKCRARFIYDQIKMSAANQICPLCNHRVVSTLDHHLPQAKFPSFSVAPVNLVPSCFDCNREKHTFIAASTNEEIGHPYFDDFSSDGWLSAEVLQTSPLTIRFYTKPPAHWPVQKKIKIENHFQKLKLGQLYKIHAATELVEMRAAFVAQQSNGGVAALQVYLLELANSKRQADLNSWRSALYTALSEDVWFLAYGTASIPKP